MSLYLYNRIFDTSRGKNALKNQYLQKVISVIDSELALLEIRFIHPERFAKEQTFKSDLYIIPKSDDGLGIIGFVELIVALFLLGGIYAKNGKKATLAQIAKGFELMFNFKFGSIYKKQIKLFDRKACNLTRLLDSLRNLLIKESRRRYNE